VTRSKEFSAVTLQQKNESRTVVRNFYNVEVLAPWTVRNKSFRARGNTSIFKLKVIHSTCTYVYSLKIC